ncbi:MAG TPA: class I tRNA ligase family protein, partial [Candidatus Dormibacteraeota bacterium]|nr:class I tRNA ligase family protein [Candidatus Dormibacteraeota bacterium]
RPETMLGDTGVAVAPGDPRYSDLVGRWAVLPLTGRHVPIFEDEAVEPQFGTGALKVTPGHDPTDYEIGSRHRLPIVTVIGPDGRMDVPDMPRFHGIPAEVARDLVTQALREAGAVAGVEPYVHDVGHCDRCGSVLEPLVSEQWWVRMRELAEPGIAAVERGAVRFHPERPHTGVYLEWMRNIRDWCISRQIWLGHRVPVATCASGHRFAWVDPPDACEVCGTAELTLDPDVLDTWFSSALWPFAIFGWPRQTRDLARFYPTQVLVTAREIIFLWVARMIMTGLHFMRDIPFGDVLINSTIQAADGSRMSKSRGNGVDPADMVERYGADAVRAWAGAVGTAAQDMRFDEKRIESYRSFANKLWNVTRLLVLRAGDGDGVVRAAPEPEAGGLRPVDRWLLWRVAACADAVSQSIEQFRFHDAMERLYDTVWHVYCDDYVEAVKDRLGDVDDPAAWVASTALDTLLRLLHPFMPFVTEECAQRLPGAAATLQRRQWPAVPALWREGEADAAAVDAALELVVAVRQARQEAGIAPKQPLGATIDASGPLGRADLGALLAPLAWVRVLEVAPDGATRLSAVAAGGALEASVWVSQARSDGDAAHLRRQRDDLVRRVASQRAKLAAPGFVEKAPGHVVAGVRTQLAEAEGQLAAVDRLLGGDVA